MKLVLKVLRENWVFFLLVFALAAVGGALAVMAS